jgi:Tfp pilus assembly protein PilN
MKCDHSQNTRHWRDTRYLEEEKEESFLTSLLLFTALMLGAFAIILTLFLLMV